MRIPLLKQYSKLRTQLENLEGKRRELENEILDELEKDGLDVVAYPFGTFSKTHRVVWKYSEKYRAVEEKYKLILDAGKRTDIEEGLAEKVESIGLTFRKHGENENK